MPERLVSAEALAWAQREKLAEKVQSHIVSADEDLAKRGSGHRLERDVVRERREAGPNRIVRRAEGGEDARQLVDSRPSLVSLGRYAITSAAP